MLRTITVGSCVSVQGLFVAQLTNGKVVIEVDQRRYTGYPVTSVRKTLSIADAPVRLA